MSLDAALLDTLQPLVERLKAAGDQLAAEAERARRTDATGIPADKAAFTVKEVANFLQVAPETVREWFYSGRLKGMQTGNRILVWRWSLLELMGLKPDTKEKPRR